MLNKSQIKWIIISISVSFICLTSKALENQNYELQRQMFLMDVNSVENISLKADFGKLQNISDEMEKKWINKDSELYVSMMLEICRTFHLHDFHNVQQFEMARKFAILALEKSNKLQEKSKINVEIELQLVTEYILNNYDYNKESQKKDWLGQRSLISKQCFYSWIRLESAIDPNFDINQPLPFWPQPSKYDGIWMTGMSPESIKDPTVRAEYQKSLDKFNETMHQYNDQKQLRKLKNEYLPKIQRQIIKLYSGPAFDSKNLEVEALEKDMAKYIKGDKIRNNMLEEIKIIFTKLQKKTKSEELNDPNKPKN